MFYRKLEADVRGCTINIIELPFVSFFWAPVFLFLPSPPIPVSKPLERVSFELRNGVLIKEMKKGNLVSSLPLEPV